MPYTTQVKIEAYMGSDLKASQQTQIATWISAADTWIDNFLGTTFVSAEDTKYYDGNGLPYAFIDEFEGTPTVVFLDEDGNDESTLGSADFITYPLNNTVKNRIEMSDGGSYGKIPKGRKRLKVTADFGRSSVPTPVEMASTMLVAKMVKMGEQGGIVEKEKLGQYEIGLKQIDDWADVLGIRNMLMPYKVLEI